MVDRYGNLSERRVIMMYLPTCEDKGCCIAILHPKRQAIANAALQSIDCPGSILLCAELDEGIGLFSCSQADQGESMFSQAVRLKVVRQQFFSYVLVDCHLQYRLGSHKLELYCRLGKRAGLQPLFCLHLMTVNSLAQPCMMSW